jgi:anthranilate synthase component 2
LKLLMLDNYDSFTWNLVQYLGELGAVLQVVRNDEWNVKEVLAYRPDAIVISPGPGTPNEAGISVDLISACSGTIPILGVCLGHQSMGVAFGATIVRAGVIMHGKTSAVTHDNDGLFQGLPQPFEATRYHSLVIAPDSLPPELKVIAWVDDPDGQTIMGIAHQQHPTWGVQFHPESILTKDGKSLLANFLRLVDEHGRAS